VTKTSPTVLIVLAVLGAAVGWLLELAMLTTGRPLVIPPITLGAALALIGVIVLVSAIPVYRSVHRASKSPVDPFYATRVVVLAKASSLTGALLGGGGLAIVSFLLSRSVVPALGSVSMAIFAAAGAIILLVGGLIAERMCTLPPDDDEADDRTPGATTI